MSATLSTAQTFGTDGLPSAALFALWIRLGWGVVVGALTFHLLRRLAGFSKLKDGLFAAPLLPLAAGTAVGLKTLLAPGAWSAAYWLGLAFFSPSGLLVALCIGSVWLSLQPSPTHQTSLPPLLAAGLVLAGALLYASHLAWLPVDLYSLGFRSGATLAVLGAAAALNLALLWGGQASAAWALAAALLLHGAFRLPTGNAWDALLDPWLWLWAAVSLLRLRTMRA